MATAKRALELYRERYFDLNVRHFHEKLRGEHEIELSYSWVKGVLQGAGLIARGRKRGQHRKRRPRRPLPGMPLHIDGSEHRWFQDERWYDLLVILDDASSEIYYAQLVEEESSTTVLGGLREVIERKGVLCALYSDRAGASREPHPQKQPHSRCEATTLNPIPDISLATKSGHFNLLTTRGTGNCWVFLLGRMVHFDFVSDFDTHQVFADFQRSRISLAGVWNHIGNVGWHDV